MSNALKIIEALGRHEDAEAISVLRDLGTNSSRDDVREETAKALIRNTDMNAKTIAVKSMEIASEICIFTNSNFVVEEV